MRIRLCAVLIAPCAAIVFLASVLTAQTPVWKGKITKDGDVTVVQNPKEPMFKGDILTLKEDLRLGGSEAKGDSSFGEVMSLSVDPQGNIYALDYKESNVKVFDKTGKFLLKFGRKGQGPGEFNGPRNLAFDRTGALFVLETGRISSFDPQGKFLKSISLKGILGMRMRVDSAGKIYVFQAVLSEKEAQYVINKYDSEMKLISLMAQAPTGVKSSGPSNPFRPIPYFEIDEKNRFIFGFPKSYEIQVFTPAGKLAGRILKDYDPVEVTAEEIAEQKKDNPFSMPLEFSKYHAAYRKFFTDDEGRLFVQTFAVTKNPAGHIFDIFDSEGRYLGSDLLADNPVLIKNGRLYAVESDEDGNEMIKRYAITWKTGR